MSRAFVLAGFALAVCAMLWTSTEHSVAAEPAPKGFEGKVLLIYFKGRNAEHAFTLEQVTVGQLHGKQVLHGKHVDTGEDANWMNGRRTTVDWTSVESVIYYDSPEDYKKAIAEFGDESL